MRVVQGTIIGKHKPNKKGSIYQNLTNFSENPLSSEKRNQDDLGLPVSNDANAFP